MSGSERDAAFARARLLAALNHDLRAPLARIATRAGVAVADPAAREALAAMGEEARRQLEWLADLQECVRFELQPPELAAAPAYLHALLRHMKHEGDLPALAVLDARRLLQVLDRLRAHAGGALALRAQCGDGQLRLRVQAGAEQGPWRPLQASLGDERIAPGLLLAMHLVRAMGGTLQCSGDDALRFEIAAALAEERDAMAPAPHFDWPEPFGSGHAILLLEPHQPMQDYLSEILESAEFDVQYEPDAREPALILCADETVWDLWPREEAPPVLLHAMLPPQRPQDFSEVLYKPAPPALLLAALRRRLQIRL